MSHVPYVPIAEFEERTSGSYTATLLDEAGVPVPAVDIESITMWLRDVKSGAYINGREEQNAFDENDVSFGETDGVLTWAIRPEDNAFVGSDASLEEFHEVIFHVIWAGGAKAKTRRDYLKVKQVIPLPIET